MFSGFYLALFVVLAALIVRGVASSTAASATARAGGPAGTAPWPRAAWCPHSRGPDLRRPAARPPAVGLGPVRGTFTDLFPAAAVVGGPASLAMSLAHGATFLSLKTAGPLTGRARRVAMWLSPPAGALVMGTAFWLAAAGFGSAWRLPGLVPLILAWRAGPRSSPPARSPKSGAMASRSG
jgi:cytochrome bd ubiquinol oxidase subunit II